MLSPVVELWQMHFATRPRSDLWTLKSLLCLVVSCRDLLQTWFACLGRPSLCPHRRWFRKYMEISPAGPDKPCLPERQNRYYGIASWEPMIQDNNLKNNFPLRTVAFTKHVERPEPLAGARFSWHPLGKYWVQNGPVWDPMKDKVVRKVKLLIGWKILMC